MKRKLSIVLLFLLCIFFNSIKSSFVASASEKLNINAKSAVVLEVVSGRIIYEKNSNSKRFLASTTKILTAITIIENCDINSQVIVGQNTVGVEGSSIYLEVGEKLSVLDLLYGLMLRSGNDCAETLAVYCSGSISEFAKLMNNTAKKIGAFNSNFVNPHGLHDENHYTTAMDLALISRYAMQNETFRQIVGTKSIKIPFTTRDSARLLINKNKLLSRLEGCTGIKTGYTKKAGRCLVSSVKKDNFEYICVVLDCPNMWEESISAFNYAFNEFSNKIYIDKSNIVSFIPIKNCDKKCPVYIKNNIIIPVTDEEKNSYYTIIDVPKEIPLGTKKDTLIGDLKIYVKKSLLFSEKIYTIIDI